MNWGSLDFWKSDAWASVQNKLARLDEGGIPYNPPRMQVFRAMDDLGLEEIKVVIMGQDPYPNAEYATGRAFSIPPLTPLTPSLRMIFRELHNDLGLPIRTDGDLTGWVQQGVFLWNTVPTCLTGISMSHYEWPEWHQLTKEIVEKLDARAVPFALLGSVAREYLKYIKFSDTVETGHPSPRGNRGRVPFLGCRMFSTLNGYLCKTGEKSINWQS